jgi:hypothetical protein
MTGGPYIPDWTEQPGPYDEPERDACRGCGGEIDTGGKYCSDCYCDMDRERQDQEAEIDHDEPKE